MQRWLVISAIALLGCGFCFGVVSNQAMYELILTRYAEYNSELHHQLAQSANAYDNAIKRVWQLEAELDYYKPSYTRLEEAYDWLLNNPAIVKVPIEVKVVEYQNRNIFPRQFENIERFEEWYEAQDFKPLFPSGAYQVDCDDYAGRLQRVALEQGYSVSQALVLNGKYYGIRVSGDIGGHTGNLVLIGNTYYYIEPEPSKFKVVELVERD